MSFSFYLMEPTPSALRAEKARYQLTLQDIIEHTGSRPMSAQLLSMYLSEYRPLTELAQRRLASAFNTAIESISGVRPFREPAEGDWQERVGG